MKYIVKITGTDLKILEPPETAVLDKKDFVCADSFWGSNFGFFSTIIEAKIWKLEKKKEILDFHNHNFGSNEERKKRNKSIIGEKNKIDIVLNKYQEKYPEYYI